jgi:hypothetical protein
VEQCGVKWGTVEVSRAQYDVVGVTGARPRKTHFGTICRRFGGILRIQDFLLVCGCVAVKTKNGYHIVNPSGAHESAGKLSGEGRREGPVEDSQLVLGRAEGVRQSVLHHQPNRRIGAHLPDESLDGY